MKAAVDGDDDLSIGIPLLADNGEADSAHQHQLGHHNSGLGSTSFFKTCFNGVNALSGSLYYSYLFSLVFYFSHKVELCLDFDIS